MRWLGNVLGANAWGSSFIVGDGQVFPHCTQHQVANIVGSLDGTAPVLRRRRGRGPELARRRAAGSRTCGACPAGGGDAFARFNSSAVYRDNVESYSTVEPAIDLTATSPLAFARVAAGRSTRAGAYPCGAHGAARLEVHAPAADAARDRRDRSRGVRREGDAEDAGSPHLISRSRACTRQARRSHTARPETAMSDESRVPANRIESGEWLR